MNSESTRHRYLRRMFQLNPMWQATEVIDLRSRALKIERLDRAHSNGDRMDVQALRQAAKRQVADLQAEFWKMPLGDLKRQLEAIDVRQLPDLAPVVGRLRTVASCRGEFPRLAQEDWMDLKLLNAFRAAAVLPPTEAGYAREAFLARVHDKKDLRRIQYAARKIQSEYPVLFALEHDWFKTLSKHKLHRTSANDNGGGLSIGVPELGWPMWLLIVFIIRMLLRVLSMTGGN